MKKKSDIEEAIELATLRGDYYPIMRGSIDASGRKKAVYPGNVPIIGRVASVEGGWIAMQLHVMVPSESTTILIKKILETVDRYSPSDATIASKLKSQLEESIKDFRAGDWQKLGKIWPEEAELPVKK